MKNILALPLRSLALAATLLLAGAAQAQAPMAEPVPPAVAGRVITEKAPQVKAANKAAAKKHKAGKKAAAKKAKKKGAKKAAVGKSVKLKAKKAHKLH